MPQKKNPGPLELTRSRASTVMADLFQVMSIVKGLISGYNRDFQDTKEPLMRSLSVTADSLVVMRMVFEKLGVNAEACIAAFRPEIFAADVALRMATEEDVPFREAYKQVGLNLEALAKQDPVENIKSKTHTGAPGNLGLDKALERSRTLLADLQQEAGRIEKVKSGLINN